MNQNLDTQVTLAQTGDKDALEHVIRDVQDKVHHLAMRFLVNPEDALDATQEILVQIITKLSTFEAKSQFTTWVYRVAVNYLLNAKKVQERDPGLNFDLFREDLESNLTESGNPEHPALLNELRTACTMAMLLCLDLKHRAAYVVGDILEIDSHEAASILSISRENFRKRLSRARSQIERFTLSNCGIANTAAKCHCNNRLPAAVQMGRVQPEQLIYSDGFTHSYSQVVEQARQLEDTLKVLCLQRATPHYSNPSEFGTYLSELIANHA